MLSGLGASKAMAGLELLRVAMGSSWAPGGHREASTAEPRPGDTGEVSPAAKEPPDPVMATAKDGTTVRMHGVLDKPAGSGCFHGEEWRPKYFVLRSDLVLEYYAAPVDRAVPPPRHGGLACHRAVLGDLGAVRGSYPLARLCLREARAEGPRLHIRLGQDVRFGGQAVRHLQLQASAADRGLGAPHAAQLMREWARALSELLEQSRCRAPTQVPGHLALVGHGTACAPCSERATDTAAVPWTGEGHVGVAGGTLGFDGAPSTAAGGEGFWPQAITPRWCAQEVNSPMEWFGNAVDGATTVPLLEGQQVAGLPVEPRPTFQRLLTLEAALCLQLPVLPPGHRAPLPCSPPPYCRAT